MKIELNDLQIGLLKQAIEIQLPLVENSARRLSQFTMFRDSISSQAHMKELNALRDILSQLNRSKKDWKV